MAKVLFWVGLIVFLGGLAQGLASLYVWPAILPFSPIAIQIMVFGVSSIGFLLIFKIFKQLFLGLFFMGFAARAGATALSLVVSNSALNLPFQVMGSLIVACVFTLLMGLSISDNPKNKGDVHGHGN